MDTDRVNTNPVDIERAQSLEECLFQWVRRFSWFLLGLSALLFAGVCLLLLFDKYGWLAKPVSEVHRWIASSVFFLQVALFLFGSLFVILLSRAVGKRIELKRQIDLHVKDDKIHRSTFWDAFPFATLVFFLVAAFMLFDMAYGDDSETPEKKLVKLALYVVAAIITAVVVLYGAHLVRFEAFLNELTDNTQDATYEAKRASGLASSSCRQNGQRL